MSHSSNYERTTIQISRVTREKLRILEEYQDRPLYRIVKRLVEQEFAKLPKEIRMLNQVEEVTA